MRETLATVEPMVRLMVALLAFLGSGALQRLMMLSRHSNSLPARACRFLVLRAGAESCGSVVDVRGDCYILSIHSLSIGSYVSIHPFCYIDATGGIHIGDNVSIAHSVTIMSTEHQWKSDNVPIREQPIEARPVAVESNVWIGAGVKVLGGVTIGEGSVIGAGSVVTRNIPPRSIAVGIPARVVRNR